MLFSQSTPSFYYYFSIKGNKKRRRRRFIRSSKICSPLPFQSNNASLKGPIQPKKTLRTDKAANSISLSKLISGRQEFHRLSHANLIQLPDFIIFVRAHRIREFAESGHRHYLPIITPL
jgi:hypothetical protein